VQSAVGMLTFFNLVCRPIKTHSLHDAKGQSGMTSHLFSFEGCLNYKQLQPAMPKNTNWVKWRNHPAREVILQDLNYGGWLYDELKQDEELNLALVFAICNHKHPEIFNEVDFSQFKVRMEDCTTKNKERRDHSKLEHAWTLHDRQLHPRQLKNHRGELAFDLHPAKLLLRKDVKAGAHAEMAPSQFQGTRAECQEFDRDIFRQRIYQEERHQKYLNFLGEKRTEKQRVHKEQQKRKKIGGGKAGKHKSKGVRKEEES
jgi:hypothetical protein